MGVHLCLLWLLFAVTSNFLLSQTLATFAAMTSNFFLNNIFTYGDQRLRGRAIWRGLLSFYAVCGIGALINLAIAELLFLKSFPYWVAGLACAEADRAQARPAAPRRRLLRLRPISGA